MWQKALRMQKIHAGRKINQLHFRQAWAFYLRLHFAYQLALSIVNRNKLRQYFGFNLKQAIVWVGENLKALLFCHKITLL